jgi:hypothetical protein
MFAMSAKNPLALVKETFGDKAKLVEAIEKLTGEDLWVARANKNKGLARVSNAKLLRLHATFSEVKEKFGTREKLIDAILDLEKRSKDTGLRQRLSEYPVPRLYDAYKSTAKRLRAALTKADERAAKAATPSAAKPLAKKSTKKTASKAPAKPAKKTAKKAGKKGSSKKAGRG